MKTAFAFTISLLLLIANACTSDNKSPPHLVVHEICGRDLKHTPLYRVKTPIDWQVKRPDDTESLEDTKKSLCEFLIQEGLNQIRITIHNFPSSSIEERIPPSAQILRWKRQFNDIDPLTVSTIPQSFAGFSGVFFESAGKINEIETTMFGWSMQIAPEHYRRLNENEQMRSCITIKVMGPTDFIEKNRNIIVNFSRSFELIDEIGYHP